MDKRNFAFDRTNFILLAVGMAVIIIGFILMSGAGSTEETFNPDIFSARRIKLAPLVCFAGFAFMIYGIMHKPADSHDCASEKTLEEGAGRTGEETYSQEA